MQAAERPLASRRARLDHDRRGVLRPLLTIAVIALAVCGCERRPPSLPLTNVDGSAPNVLLITIDTLRADHLGAYGYEVPTSPAVDTLAQDGAVFRRALSPASETGPGTASLLTGRYQHRHGAWRNVIPLSPDVTTLAEHLATAGYATAGFVGNRLLDRKFGFDQGFETYDGFWTDDLATPSDGTGVAMAIEWLDGAKRDRPWFLWLHLMDPHGPYTSAQPSWSDGFRYPADAFGDDPPVKRAIGNYGLGIIPLYQQIGDEARLSRYVRRYDGEIRYTDAQIGELLAALDTRGLRERTLVILSADHGESLTEHEEYLQHGWYIYDTTLQVPLMFAWNGRLPARTVVDAPVSTIDVVPTIVELLGLPASLHGFDGRSLAPVLLGGQADAERSLFAFGARANHPFAVRRGRWKLIHTAAGMSPDARIEPPPGGFNTPERLELYDTRADPGETRNLAEAHPDRVADMRGELAGFEFKLRTNLPEVGLPSSP